MIKRRRAMAATGTCLFGGAKVLLPHTSNRKEVNPMEENPLSKKQERISILADKLIREFIGIDGIALIAFHNKESNPDDDAHAVIIIGVGGVCTPALIDAANAVRKSFNDNPQAIALDAVAWTAGDDNPSEGRIKALARSLRLSPEEGEKAIEKSAQLREGKTEEIKALLAKLAEVCQCPTCTAAREVDNVLPIKPPEA